MIVESTDDGRVGLIRIRGEVDFYNSDEVSRKLEELSAAGIVRVLVDLEAVPYMDSAGVGVFVSVIHRLHKQGGGIVFLRAEASLVRVFDMFQVKSLFQFCDTEDEARARF